MRQITLDELYDLGRAAYDEIWDTAKAYGRDPKLYLHWTAGHYGTKFDDYHINIDADGNLYASTDNLADILAHTWRRNSGAIGIASIVASTRQAKTSAPSHRPPHRSKPWRRPSGNSLTPSTSRLTKSAS